MNTATKQSPKYSHIELWTRASNYSGEDLSDYYVGLSQSRDSDYMTRANFDALLDRLGGESKSVRVARFGHWGCGWAETILVHKRATAKLKILNEAMTTLEDYPVLDDSLYAEYEREYFDETFNFYASDFERQLQIYLNDSFLEQTDELEPVLRALYQADADYRGLEDAYVNADTIARNVKDSWEFQQLAKTNTLAKRIMDTVTK